MKRVMVMVGAALILISVLSRCSSISTQSSLTGRLIVWVNLTGPHLDLVNTLLRRFSELHPDAQILSEFASNDDVFNDSKTGRYGRLVSLSQAGLGPDVVIGMEDYRVRALLPTNELQPLNLADYDATAWSPSAVAALRKDGQLYAVPFSAYTTVLYYNTQKVTEPFQTIGDLIQAARAGHKIAMPIDLTYSLWGLTIFGGPFLNVNGGPMLKERGVSQWFSWVKQAAAEPNIILGDDYETMKNLFLEGDVDYFIGSSLELPTFIEQLGEDNVGVGRLPEAVFRARPIMNVETIVVMRNTTQAELIAELINFLTNEAQQRRILLSNTGRLSINTEVTIDKRVSLTAFALTEQGRNAEIFSITANGTGEVLRGGTRITEDLIEGVVTPNEATTRMLDVVATQFSK